MAPGIESLAPIAVAVVTLFGGLYTLIRHTDVIATEQYVDDTEEDLERQLDEAIGKMEDNRRRIDELRNLIEGGDESLQKGILDFVEENIKRTDEIQEDLKEIKDKLRELNGED